MPECLVFADHEILRMAGDWFNLRGLIVGFRRLAVSEAQRRHFKRLSINLFHGIRARQPDLLVEALADLAWLDFDNPPTESRLWIMVEDAGVVIEETCHCIREGLSTGIIAGVAPHLVRPKHAQDPAIPPAEVPGPVALPLVLDGPDGRPLIYGTPVKRRPTFLQMAALRALWAAGAEGLSFAALCIEVRKQVGSDASGAGPRADRVLARLIKRDRWAEVISPLGGPHVDYRLIPACFRK